MKRPLSANWERQLRRIVAALGIALALAGTVSGGPGTASAASWSTRPASPNTAPLPVPPPGE